VQKHLVCRVPESWKVLILFSPASQAIFAVDEKRFAAWADPLSLRQREQWQRKKLSKSPDIWNFTVPHRHCPSVMVFKRQLLEGPPSQPFCW
jgi:hypothetical protein